MSSLLGLLDTLEAVVLGGRKIPLSSKVILDEKEVLVLLDKFRYALNHASPSIQRNVEVATAEPKQVEQAVTTAVKQSESIKKGANDYADYVLANLQMVVTKLQKELVRLEKGIESGRDILEKAKEEQ